MANVPNQFPVPDDGQWEEVSEEFDRGSGTRQGEPTGNVNPSGLTPMNAKSSMLLIQTVKQAGLKATQFSVKYRVKAKEGLVQVRPVPEETEGKIAVARTSDKALCLHLGPVFLKHPDLRPAGRRKCICYIDEKTGFFTLSLKTGQAMQTQTRSGSDEQQSTAKQSGGKAAAASQPDVDEEQQ